MSLRLGQKNNTFYQWPAAGHGPVSPLTQRYESAYWFGALCPERDTGAALVLPKADTQAMQYHLHEISQTVAPDAHAIVLMDQASGHTTAPLTMPDNLARVFIPPASPN